MKLKNILITSAFIVLGATSINAQLYMCQSCAAGTYSKTGSETSCTACSKGTYSTGGASSCTSCSKGTYQDETGKSSCKNCPTGTYSSSTGAIACSSCAAIKYGDWSVQCGTAVRDATSYCTSTGSTSSTSSPITTKETTTRYCSSGQGCYSGKCNLCGAGTYSSGSTTSACSTCPAGKYSGAGASSCTSCPAGKYSSAGASGCTSCSAGTYSSSGASSCSDCPAGKYSSAGASGCTSCSIGYYSAAKASSCTACTNAPSSNAKYTSNATSNSCSWTCNSGYFASSQITKCKPILYAYIYSEHRDAYNNLTTKSIQRYSEGSHNGVMNSDNPNDIHTYMMINDGNILFSTVNIEGANYTYYPDKSKLSYAGACGPYAPASCYEEAQKNAANWEANNQHALNQINYIYNNRVTDTTYFNKSTKCTSKFLWWCTSDRTTYERKADY